MGCLTPSSPEDCEHSTPPHGAMWWHIDTQFAQKRTVRQIKTHWRHQTASFHNSSGIIWELPPTFNLFSVKVGSLSLANVVWQFRCHHAKEWRHATPNLKQAAGIRILIPPHTPPG